MLSSVIKVLVLAVVFPVQVHFIQPEDYLDAWWMLDEVVNSIVEQVEQPSNDDVFEMAPIDGIMP